LVSYALAGIVVLLVMRMLGEMALAFPEARTFTDYGRTIIAGLLQVHFRLAGGVFLEGHHGAAAESGGGDQLGIPGDRAAVAAGAAVPGVAFASLGPRGNNSSAIN
jgi:hypothetical protein